MALRKRATIKRNLSDDEDDAYVVDLNINIYIFPLINFISVDKSPRKRKIYSSKQTRNSEDSSVFYFIQFTSFALYDVA